MKPKSVLLAVALLAATSVAGRAEDAAPAPKQVPTADFARKAQFISAKISPGGEYLAVTMWSEDQIALAILSIKPVKMMATLRFGHHEHVGDYWWVGPNRVVTTIYTSDGPLDQPHWTGELWGMNADGSNKKYLFGYRGSESVGSHLGNSTKEYAYAQMIDPLPSDPHHALIAAFTWHNAEVWSYPALYRLDVDSGRKDPIGTIPGYEPLDVGADREGAPLFAYADDRDGKPHSYAWSVASREWVEMKFPQGTPEKYSGAAVSGDGVFAYTVVSDQSNNACLEAVTIATREVHQLKCGTGLTRRNVVFSFDGSDLPIAIQTDGVQPAELLRPDHPDAQLLQMLERSFPGQRIRISTRTLDGAKLILHVDSDRNPGDFYLLDRATRKAEYLISARDWIDPQQMPVRKPIEYAARDGTRIHGFLTMPAGVTGKAPLVVLPHGGPHSGIHDTWEWDEWPAFLASRGYAVLQPNFRGSGGYGYAFEHAGYRHWGTLMIDDITDAARWAVAHGIADPARMCIFGASWGGYAALMSAVREPDLYQCAVGFAGVYDLPSQIRDSDTADSILGRAYLAKAVGTDDDVLTAQSPITYVEQLKAPVFIIHGTADQRVPFSQAKKLRDALAKHHKPYEWLQKSGEEHGFYKDENNVELLDKLAAFLDKHIGKRAAVDAAPAGSGAGQQPQ